LAPVAFRTTEPPWQKVVADWAEAEIEKPEQLVPEAEKLSMAKLGRAPAPMESLAIKRS